MTKLSIKAQAKWKPRKAARVILDLDDTSYDYLIGCLTSHAKNEIHGTYVVNCGTARTLLDAILEAVDTHPGDAEAQEGTGR